MRNSEGAAPQKTTPTKPTALKEAPSTVAPPTATREVVSTGSSTVDTHVGMTDAELITWSLRHVAYDSGFAAGYRQALHDVAVNAAELDIINGHLMRRVRSEAAARIRNRRADIELGAQRAYKAEGRTEYRGAAVEWEPVALVAVSNVDGAL